MGNFVEALVSQKKSILIPEEYDYWGELIGGWDLDYSFHWQNETTQKDGTVKVWCEVFGRRQKA